MSELGDRLRQRFSDLRTELQPKLADLGDRVNTLVDEAQAAVDEASAKIDELQGQTGAEGTAPPPAAPPA